MSKNQVKQESKELAAAASNEVSTEVYDANEWGDVVVEAKDLILAKILLQQSGSESVKQRKARDGDYLNTLTDSVASDDKGELSVLPFYCRQHYVVEKWNGKKFEFHKLLPYIVGQDQLPFEEQIGAERFKNSHVYEFFCLLEGGGIPALVSFKSTSHKIGKKLFNIMYSQNPENKKTPAHNWITLGSTQETNDLGTFGVMNFSLGKVSVKEELDECKKWIGIIKKANFKVAEEKPSTQQPVTETRF